MTKKHTKQLLAALLAALTLLSLAACGNQFANVEESGDTAAVQQTDEQKKSDTAKTDNKKTDAKTDDSKKDTKAEDAKKDDAKTDDTKKDEVKQETPAEEKKEETKPETPKQDETPKQEDPPKQEIDPDTGKDKYQTDPVPEGKPAPVEPGTAESSGKTLTCSISISCKTILNNMDKIDDEAVAAIVPANGNILSTTTVSFTEGESVFDVLQRVCRDKGIHMEYSWTAVYNSAYIEGIANLYEFDVGDGSGWMYKVNGWFPNYGCSRYQVEAGDNICWVYTCDLGNDVGGGF